MLRSKLDMTGAPSARAGGLSDEPAPARRFEALIFDWDRGDEPHGRGDEHLGATIEEACAHGLELAIVSRMVVGELDALLAARPAGPGGLILATSWGGEVFSVDRDGLKPAFGTTARITGDAQGREVEPTNHARWVMPWLWRCGIAPEQVLIAGGRDVVVAVLQDQT